MAQPNTEVYLFDLKINEGKTELLNPKNISNNEGYDNQPSFLDENTLVYAATRDEQTDILKFDIIKGSVKTWITDTPTGSEYSPLKIPNKESVSAIRLDLDGLQRLYEYDISTGESQLILKDVKVGYHVWHNQNILVATVLVENGMNLIIANLENGEIKTIDQEVGRSLHAIPFTTQISYLKKNGDQWTIKALDPLTQDTIDLIDLMPNTQDICWLQDGSILTGNGKSLFQAYPNKEKRWKPLLYFEDEEIQNISRIAVNEQNTRLAFVSEVSPRHIVDQQLEAYNARDIEAFVNTYSENVELYIFPNQRIGKGKEDLRNTYASFFKATPDLHCEIKNRMVIDNKVIDKEFLTINGQNFSAIAIYEVKNGKIAKVTFIQ